MNELKLIEQIKTIFTNREILIILPLSLEIDWKNNSEFKVIGFKDAYFKNKHSYSKLLCRKHFYNSFCEYDYIQIIQTDCGFLRTNLIIFLHLFMIILGHLIWLVIRWSPRREIVENWQWWIFTTKCFFFYFDYRKNWI